MSKIPEATSQNTNHRWTDAFGSQLYQRSKMALISLLRTTTHKAFATKAGPQDSRRRRVSSGLVAAALALSRSSKASASSAEEMGTVDDILSKFMFQNASLSGLMDSPKICSYLIQVQSQGLSKGESEIIENIIRYLLDQAYDAEEIRDENQSAEFSLLVNSLVYQANVWKEDLGTENVSHGIQLAISAVAYLERIHEEKINARILKRLFLVAFMLAFKVSENFKETIPITHWCIVGKIPKSLALLKLEKAFCERLDWNVEVPEETRRQLEDIFLPASIRTLDSVPAPPSGRSSTSSQRWRTLSWTAWSNQQSD